MIDDIEDILLLQEDQRQEHGQVTINSFKNSIHSENSSLTESPLPEYNLPGQAKIFVKTWGCGHNNSDGEYMAGQLASHGYQVVLNDNDKSDCDLWLLNSCTVKGPSEQTFINEIQKAKKDGKKIVVAGCVPQAAPKGSEWDDLSIIGVQQIDQAVYVVEETLKGNHIQMLKESKEVTPQGKKRKTGGASLDLPKIRRNPFIEIIPINTGCLNQCTYCKTKHARGDLGSYTPKEIIDRVNTVLSEGVLEIWLTSEDTGAYGRDIGVTIIELLQGIVSAMENHQNQSAMLRIGMTNPPYILEHLKDMGRILNHSRVYSFLHVPFQAGSNRVLNDMRRLYSREEFIQVVHVLEESVPGITIATDVICGIHFLYVFQFTFLGFPTETDDDFEETMSLLKEFQFPILHISQFYPRPGTPAARLPRLPTEKVKARSRLVTKYFESYLPYQELKDTVLNVLVTDRGSDGIHFVAHDKFYRQVLVPSHPEYMGKWLQVEIINTGKYFLMGRVLSVDEIKSNVVGTHQNRMPKLIRGQKGLVKIKQDEDDGTELSIGK